MNHIYDRQLSFLLSLGAIAVLGNGLSAQAETIATASSTPATTPGTTATTVSALVPQPAEPFSEISAARVAQTNSNVEPAPSVDTTPTPTSFGVSFDDVDSNYWADPFIQGLAEKNLISGFPDGTFRPEQPVTRAEIAAMLQKTFNFPSPPSSQANFSDVPTNHWAADAIEESYAAGFMAGYPNNSFLPNQPTTKVALIDGLASGLGLTPSGSAADVVNTKYTDAGQIPVYTVDEVAAATQANIVVNYPNVKQLNPRASLTRAEAAAHLYQALVRLGQMQPLSTNVAAANYIVGGPGSVISQTPATTSETTAPTTEKTPPSSDTETVQTPEAETDAAATGVRLAPNYIGVGGSLGIVEDVYGDTGAFAAISKIRLFSPTRDTDISLRPSILVGEDVSFVVPATIDLRLRGFNFFGTRTDSFVPYFGPGFVVSTDDDVFYFNLTGGVDVPIGQFTANAALNFGFLDDFAMGLSLGIGYNF